MRTMKAMAIVATVGVVAEVALWLGYSLGYHQGARDERRAWESAAQVFQADQVDQAAHAAQAIPKGLPVRLLYSDPHPRFFLGEPAQRVNAPDPGVYRRKEFF